MTIRRMALQAAVGNLTQNQAITTDANGFLISAGLLAYAYIQNVSTTDKVLGRSSAGAGSIEEIACTAAGRAILAMATGLTYSQLQNISATDKILGRVTAGAGSIEEIACTAAGRALIDDADAAAQRTTMGIPLNNIQITGGSITGITDLAVGDGGTGSSTAAAARLALGLVDANDRMPEAKLPSKILNSYWHAVLSELTIVSGSWSQYALASETDYDDSLVSTAGQIGSGNTNGSEVNFGSLNLNAGTYKIIMSHPTNSNNGIIEILHGATSLGTIDFYSASVAYNVVNVLTYTPTTRVTGNLTVKINGKNASSNGYYVGFSRLEIIRTA